MVVVLPQILVIHSHIATENVVWSSILDTSSPIEVAETVWNKVLP